MNHRRHLLCLIPVGLALVLFLTSGGSAIFAGVGLALLLCPLVMGTVMWLLMRQPSAPATAHQDDRERIGAGRL
jgi:hypothetical protein